MPSRRHFPRWDTEHLGWMTYADTVAERERMQWRLKMGKVFDTLEMPWIADLSAMKCSTLHPLRGSTRISDCFQPRRQFCGVLK
ncbi:hypothetical protein BC2230_120212 [Burkholderia cepacia]